jgi:hypothetical protein
MRPQAPVRALLAELAACKARIGDVLTQGRLPLAKDGERASAFMRYLRVFEIEFLCALGEWATLADVVQVGFAPLGREPEPDVSFRA